MGAFIGCGVGALLIAVTDPWKALFFIVLFLVLQQIEGNLIYPHVVGSSVGLPSIWVLAAVTLGGKLMGILGMLLFIPLCSVLYALFRSFVKGRLAEKKVPSSRWRDAPPDPKRNRKTFGNIPKVFFYFSIDNNPCQCYAMYDNDHCHFDCYYWQEGSDAYAAVQPAQGVPRPFGRESAGDGNAGGRVPAKPSVRSNAGTTLPRSHWP